MTGEVSKIRRLGDETVGLVMEAADSDARHEDLPYLFEDSAWQRSGAGSAASEARVGRSKRALGRSTVRRPRLKTHSTGATVATASAGLRASMTTISAGWPTASP